MSKIYIAVAIIAAIFFAWWAGGRIAREQCRADAAMASSAAQNQIKDTKGEVDAQVFHTAVADIRDRLREKYTIAD